MFFCFLHHRPPCPPRCWMLDAEWSLEDQGSSIEHRVCALGAERLLFNLYPRLPYFLLPIFIREASLKSLTI
ncbi:MAG: hypothetical protein AB1797_09140 [bacterium]